MKKKNIPKSLEYYQQHFDCARTEKPEQRIRSQIDQARVIYGIAKANANIGNINIINIVGIELILIFLN